MGRIGRGKDSFWRKVNKFSLKKTKEFNCASLLPLFFLFYYKIVISLLSYIPCFEFEFKILKEKKK